jgi:phospholipase/lecithinase/hemolysin
MKKQIVTAGFVLLSFMLPAKASAGDFTGIYVFGDSLSDGGNVYNATINPDTGIGFPPPPYSEGRFTNGPIWIDALAERLNLQSPTPFIRVTQGVPPQDGINFAFGGATTTPANTLALTFPELAGLPGLPQEIVAFQTLLSSNNQSQADPNALYILWAGANDYNPTQGSFPPFTTPDATLENLANTLQTLAGLGVKKVLVPNLPDLGATPLALSLEPIIPGTSQRLSELTLAHNAGLSQLIQEFDQNPNLDLDVIPLDVYSLFSDPQALGFTTVTTPCLVSIDPLIQCDNPEEHLFWDLQHPTTTGHQILGNYAFQVLEESHQSVPEPTTTLGMLALGALGATGILKRQQKMP